MKLQSLTNVRPTRDLGVQVIASCTKGQFKITPDAAEKLQLVEGDYADIQKDIETGTLYIVAGEKGNGGKLANNGSGLTFSAAVAWNASKADEDHNTHYDLGEAVEVEVEGTTKNFYPLEFAEQVEKMQRGPKNEDGDANTASVAASNDEDASFEEM